MVSEKQVITQSSAVDDKDHYGVIILGAGVSGLAANIQLKRKLGFTDVLCYEKSNDIGGTWNANRYPGAACDIPFSVYSFSFAPPVEHSVGTQWASQPEIMSYLHSVQRKFDVKNIVFGTLCTEASYSRETGLWTLKIKDVKTGVERVRTCNIFISAVGGLANPNLPPFNVDDFEGSVFHSAEWDQSVSLKDKDVVVVGNGCSAAQIVPELVKDVKSLTQIARSRQSIIRRPKAPDSKVMYWLRKYVPGFGYLLRALIFFILESFFLISDITKGAKKREKTLEEMDKYIKDTAPQKYWDDLKPDFDVAAKRRVFDSGYYKSLNDPKITLLQDDSVVNAKGDQVITKNGVKVKADIIVLCTGFRVRDFLFPLKIYNGEGVSLQDCLKENKVATFRGTCVQDFPNYFWLMGPNTATGHSSVIFTSECQITMMLKLIKPILRKISQVKLLPVPAPSVEVTAEAQARYNADVRKEMKNKVWEKDGGVSWYVDQETGLCTTLYPWSQVHFWWKASWPKESDFKRLGM
ncbi:hypothetical protein BCR35DRAFT_356412 [Leucosporidium creatinivorum]|uniref:FAD/NAD(P)-binding domain-containing protein n=1 Tax=Leucosporidium creatinivorum TaxID=106004 RepID=A0A1Y2C455_9BASI|nr:hypothetical protein BCR35DRAFT_356412 [Leucosporidium creatinivorum]